MVAKYGNMPLVTWRILMISYPSHLYQTNPSKTKFSMKSLVKNVKLQVQHETFGQCDIEIQLIQVQYQISGPNQTKLVIKISSYECISEISLAKIDKYPHVWNLKYVCVWSQNNHSKTIMFMKAENKKYEAYGELDLKIAIKWRCKCLRSLKDWRLALADFLSSSWVNWMFSSANLLSSTSKPRGTWLILI